ncbi:MAG: DUF1284 domain-containing protein [Nanoarchaeota archaeon]|nr:DUF1284 domain-containing protein [Nanoarchaeota archaeon]
MDSIELRAHHVDCIGYNFLTNFKDFGVRYDNYGKEFVGFLKELIEKLLENPEQEVKIVKGFDSICNHKNPFCERRDEGCGDDLEDSVCERGYGLEINKTYTMEELLKRIELFHNKSKTFLTPHEKYLYNREYLIRNFD